MTWDRIQDLVQQLEEACAESGMSYLLAVAQPDKDFLNHLCKSWIQIDNSNALEDMAAEVDDTMGRALAFNDMLMRSEHDMEDDDEDEDPESWLQ